MSKIRAKKRHLEIIKKRKRRQKLRKLKEDFFSSKSKEEKEKILEKIRRIAPHLSLG